MDPSEINQLLLQNYYYQMLASQNIPIMTASLTAQGHPHSSVPVMTSVESIQDPNEIQARIRAQSVAQTQPPRAQEQMGWN